MRSVFPAYRDKTLEDFQIRHDSHRVALGKVEKYRANLDQHRTTGYGVTLIGPNGVGKTMLACCGVLREAQERGYRVEAVELSNYVSLHKELFGLQFLIKAGHDDSVDRYVEVKRHIRSIQGLLKRSADWVLFDDVGREYPSESGWSQQEFFDTLRFRWNRNLPTVLTTNLPLADLDRRYTEGLGSLLAESSEVIMVEGDDYRWRRDS